MPRRLRPPTVANSIGDNVKKTNQAVEELSVKNQKSWYRTVQPTAIFENQLFSYKEAARYLSISETYLRRLKSKGKISFVAIGTRGIRFKVSALTRWVNQREVS